ncbi:DNA repair helicase Rad25 [Natronomonas moolapensis 8.8.11]|uniref:DNA 3'-5' helicase n=1 Tax=Natronomonas moolapensis (strain DSM 18674 / CECT 7526 / JCM 14361 / 8.8.11) TaxID=268739 RepID=M1XTG4_NATM8|nr:DEAD/DEAH box helicase family protein [Natronomonas moolapensis]CCQ37708.1 DNA repair helicase Rad25 [Natronomonas moolapensis 8.8.11]
MLTLRYDEGTIRIEDAPDDVARLSFVEADPRSETHRAPAYRYPFLRRTCADRGLRADDRVLDRFGLGGLSTTYDLRGYQTEALDAWRDAGDRGVIELPTGSGKTVVAIGAIAALDTPTLVVVPTIDLLEQWAGELEAEFGETTAIGRLGGGDQRLEPITVATYDSAYLRAEAVGDRFGLLVFDEVHHLGGAGYRDVARLSAAPARLGLTATFERPDGAHETIEELLGPVVYRRSADDLAGEHLADYDIKRIEVELTPEERASYEAHQGTFTDYLAASGLQLRSGSDYQELVKRSGSDPKAREALLAKQRAREVMLNADRKREVLADLLDRHRGDRLIVFTAYTDLVYELASRFLIPPITNETPADERREILDRFRRGAYSRVVAANVLDEGVDVPDANVAVVLSGSGSEREFTQRLGRVLRPKDDGGRAILYEVVTTETAEMRVSRRRR